MKYLKIVFCGALFVFLGYSYTFSQYSLGKSCIASGSTMISGASNTIRGTLGQAGITRIYDSDYDFHSGFWYLGGLPGVVYSTGFENGGTMPSGWTISYESGSVDWIAYDGSSAGTPSSAHSGDHNALYYYASLDGYTSKLVTPEIDFGDNDVNPEIKFWHAMADNAGNQDELRIYYKTSAGGLWNLVETYTSNTPAWTLRTLDLPNVNSTYYIAFEGKALNGYGVCVDDVTVSGTDPLCYTDLYLENLTYVSTERRTYRASNDIYISNTGGVFTIEGDGSSGGRIALAAGTSITLKPGFHAKEGSKFSAILDADPCNIFIDFSKIPALEEPPVYINPFAGIIPTVRLYPNPTNGIFNLEFTGDIKDFQKLEIRSLIGEKVFVADYFTGEKIAIDISSRTTGIYIVNLIIGKHVYTGKIIKL